MNRKNISGLRRLHGEDVGYGDRLYKQQYQQRLWLDQQVREKRARSQSENAESGKWQTFFRQCSDYATAEEESIKQRYLRLQREVAAANRQILREKQNQHQLNVRDELAAAERERLYNLTCAFMTEDPKSTQSALGAHRYIPYHFKGLSETQRNAIIDGRQRQVKERLEQAHVEKEADKERLRVTKAHCDLADKLEKEIREGQARLNRAYRDCLKTQMLENQDKNADPFNLRGRDVLLPL